MIGFVSGVQQTKLVSASPIGNVRRYDTRLSVPRSTLAAKFDMSHLSASFLRDLRGPRKARELQIELAGSPWVLYSSSPGFAEQRGGGEDVMGLTQ